MKKIFYLIILFIPCLVVPAIAQDEIDKVLESSIEDANNLIEGYINPFMNGVGTGMAGGWYNTAKPHQTLGFDLTVTLNAVRIPDSDLFYDVSNLNNTELISGGTEAPTLFGPDQEPRYRYSYTDSQSGETLEGEFNGPPGIGIQDEIGMQAMPVPMVNLGIGVIKNTDLKLRWTPTINFGDDADFKLLGIGVMHDIKQYMQGIKTLPFDLSAFVGYTHMRTNIYIEETVSSNTEGVSTENGNLAINFNSLTVQGLISKKISVLTVYGGLGFNRVRSSTVLEGEYTVRTEDTNGQPVERIYIDPVDLNFQTGGPRMTAGFRLKLTILTLHAEYTLQKYNTLTFGVGFSVR